MAKFKDKLKGLKGAYIQVVAVVLLIVLAIFLLWYNNSNSMQAESALLAKVYFDGEYKIADGEWQQMIEGEHIPATKGDVTLRGNFHMLTPNGEYVGIYRGDLAVAFYTNHINLTIIEAGAEPEVIDMENPLYKDSACGVNWTAKFLTSNPEDTIEIIIHNPHSYGNETAIDEMLSGFALWDSMSFEKDILNSGEPQRNSGMLLVLMSIVFLGIALFSSLIHIKNSKIIWLIGLVVLFAGLYLVYSAVGVSFWSESIVSNTTIHLFSMMFYMLFLSMIIVCLLRATRIVGNITLIVLSVGVFAFLLVPIVSEIFFYDLLPWWAVLQAVANIVFGVCLVREFILIKEKTRWLRMGAVLPLLAFLFDAIGVKLGSFGGAIVSQLVFVALFVVAMVMVLRFIPSSINATTKARELELEKTMLNSQLVETRISTMISQIRPHFIYNTLGSIEQLCKLEPPKAAELVHNFAKYLRGNFGELDNPKPILMSQEMEHVRYYISIENVRFPDMTFTFEMNSEDFKIPALTVQPIVENAIKHGLMKLPKGGTINVVSYDTDDEHCILVVDDGVGFDTNTLTDDREHLGLRNIRERLKVMVGGTLEIESAVGVGTRVTIKIPKESESKK